MCHSNESRELGEEREGEGRSLITVIGLLYVKNIRNEIRP